MTELSLHEAHSQAPGLEEERRQVVTLRAEATDTTGAAEAGDVGTLLPSIRRRHANRITAELVIPAREGTYADFPGDLDPRIATALRARGIERLYSHQRAAWD